MINVDVVIFGGGIAGLWTLARLTQQGFNALLLETEALGAGQTIRSQGIIHGGLKYALGGNLNNAATALQDMPQFWQQCIAGNGELNLSGTRILAQGQYLWSADKLTGGLSALFASSSMHSHVVSIDKAQLPLALVDSAIQSKAYQLQELVLDVPSLLNALATPVLDRCLKVSADDFMLEIDPHNQIKCISLKFSGATIQIKAQRYVFTAGRGNADFIKQLTGVPAMQLRPLHMVLVKAKTLLPLFGHCVSLSAGMVPRLTITTHTTADHVPIWYLGGKLAEDGVTRSTEQQITFARRELSGLFPNIDFTSAQFASFFVDRSEAKQADGKKPNTVTVYAQNNYITAWPTKLALAPLLAQEVMDNLIKDNIKPLFNTNLPPSNFPRPTIAKAIWDQLLCN